jgi:hypothetical protein
MENKNIHLVLTYIDEKTETAKHYYQGEYSPDDCWAKVSSRGVWDQIMIPLWFDSEQAAQEYIVKASQEIEKEYLLIQEFTYKNNERQDEAKIVMKIKSDSWPVLAEGKTERSPGVWANVLSFFLPVSVAADYIRRFNDDASAAFELIKIPSEV